MPTLYHSIVKHAFLRSCFITYRTTAFILRYFTIRPRMSDGKINAQAISIVAKGRRSVPRDAEPEPEPPEPAHFGRSRSRSRSRRNILFGAGAGAGAILRSVGCGSERGENHKKENTKRQNPSYSLLSSFHSSRTGELG